MKVFGMISIEDVQLNITLAMVVVIIGIPFSVIGIISGTRLLKLEHSLNGFRKPMAYTLIISSICFATLILVPVGLILSSAFTFMLGLVFLKSGEQELELEFV